MKRIAMFLVAVTATLTAAFGGSTEALRQKLDAAIKAEDWSTAEKVSKIIANMAIAENNCKQAEFLTGHNKLQGAILNIYRAAPAMLRVVNTIMSPVEGTEEHLFLRVIAPNIMSMMKTGKFNETQVVSEINAFKKAEEERAEASRKKWAAERRSWDQCRNKR